MAGAVTAELEAVLPLGVHGPDGRTLTVDAVVDTGFDGDLTLPGAVIHTLGLTWLSQLSGTLANGSAQLFDVYQAWVEWNGRRRPVLVGEAGPDPLIGMLLLSGHELRIEVRSGGAVAVRPLPPDETA